MKLRLFALFLVFALLGGCSVQLGSSPGHVFHCTEQVTELVDTGDIQRTVYEYDEKWRLSNVITYENGVEFARLSYEWNEDSTLCRITGSGGTPYVEDCAYTYDEQGNVLTAVRSEGGEVISREEYTYDASGNVLTHRAVSPMLGSETATGYRYDKAGNCIEAVSDYGNGLTVTTRTEYDKQGRPLSEISDTYRRSYEYRDKERLTVITNYVITGQGKEAETYGGTTLITHDEYGNEILQEHYSETGELIMQITASYVPESD